MAPTDLKKCFIAHENSKHGLWCQFSKVVNRGKENDIHTEEIDMEDDFLASYLVATTLMPGPQ